MTGLLRDIFKSAIWKFKFSCIDDYAMSTDDIDSLVKDYNLTKDKELAKCTRQRRSALKEKIKIGDSLKNSSFPNEQSGTSKQGGSCKSHKQSTVLPR